MAEVTKSIKLINIKIFTQVIFILIFFNPYPANVENMVSS